jgi:hypothetical protein
MFFPVSKNPKKAELFENFACICVKKIKLTYGGMVKFLYI